MSTLVFVGGWAHPVAQTGPATAEALASLKAMSAVRTSEIDRDIARLGRGVDAVSVVDDFESVIGRLTGGSVELLVINACRFQMADARYTPEQRDAFRSSTPTEFRDEVALHLDDGKPLLALHTAVLSFDDWSAWPDIVGGSWNWDRSNHPPPGSFEVRPVGEFATECQPFTVVDELYRFLEPDPDVEIIAVATDSSGGDHPIAWRHQRFGGRVVYSSLGHDARSLSNPGHRRFLGALVQWLWP